MQSGCTWRTWTRTGTLDFNWALFRRFIADSHTNPLQSICKSLYLKTETDKTSKARINANSFSLTKTLMKLMESKWPLMPLGQFFFRFSIFSQSFLCNENCIDIFQVSPLTAHVDSKFLAMWFAVRFLFLPWGFRFCPEVFCFCREVFGFAVTVVGHRTPGSATEIKRVHFSNNQFMNGILNTVWL